MKNCFFLAALLIFIPLFFLSFPIAVNADIIAVLAHDYFFGSDEHDNLSATLSGMGHTAVDVTSTAEAVSADACALIVYPGGWDVGVPDLETWVNNGSGLIQIGDWHDYFTNEYDSGLNPLPTPTAVDINITNPAHPVAQGVASNWSGRGYFYYAWPDGAIGYTLGSSGETEIGTLDSPITPLYNNGIAALDTGTGRAVYFGMNVYGPAAGINELTLLQNSLSWIGCTEPEIPSPVISLPTTRQSYPYDPVASPVKNINPANAKPIGIGSAASGGETLTVKIRLAQFAGQVDIYGAYIMWTDPQTVNVLNPDGSSFSPFTVNEIDNALLTETPPSGANPWKSNTNGPINEELFSMPISSLPPGAYTAYLLVTQAGSLNNYYLWETSFVIP